MKQIEQILPLLYASMPESQPTSTFIPAKSSTRISDDEDLSAYTSIATIDEILPGSPAAEGGLTNGDQLLKFGEVSSRSMPKSTNPLADIPAVVKFANDNNADVPLVVRRGGEVVKLVIRPKPWGGRGLLGCHLTPIK
jgi:26S proteasome non-ATPase regulatory subunit 9